MQIMTDSPIRFPGLFGDWAFTASSKALDIGNGIYWYGILIALGLVIAIWWCMNQKSKYGITEDDLLDSVLWGIPAPLWGQEFTMCCSIWISSKQRRQLQLPQGHCHLGRRPCHLRRRHRRGHRGHLRQPSQGL